MATHITLRPQLGGHRQCGLATVHFTLALVYVNGAEILGHWGGVIVYH